MKQKLSQEELEYIRKLLQSKPNEKYTANKKWLDNHVNVLLAKYKKSNKLF